MKIKIITLLTACLLLWNCLPVYANVNANSNIIVDADSIEEIKAMEEDLISEINSTFRSKNINIKSSDINYEKMITLYTDVELYENGKPNNAQMQNAVKNSDYVLYLPIECNEKTVMICFQKGEEVTNDERKDLSADTIASLEEKAGKWYIASMGIQSELIDYKAEVLNALDESNIQNANVYFVNNITQNITMGALICSDDADTVWFKIIKQFESQTEGDGGSTFDKNVLHSYDEIKAAADADKEARQDFSEDAVGGIDAATETNNSKIIIISAAAGAAVIAIAVAAVCVVKKRKKLNK